MSWPAWDDRWDVDQRPRFAHDLPRQLGYWRLREDDPPDLPHPTEMIDPTWDLDVRRRVVAYLRRRKFLLPYFYAGHSRCRICGTYGNGNQELSDGVFVWPSGLAHYVEDHDVRLPAEFVTHALRRRRRTTSAAKPTPTTRASKKTTTKKKAARRPRAP